MKLISLFLFTCLIIVGCSNSSESDLSESVQLPETLQGLENVTVIPSDKGPSHSIQFIKQIEVGESFSRGSVANISDVDEDGRIYLVNPQTMGIDIFDSTGNLLQTVSREGRGPGELVNPGSVKAVDDHLYVNDSIQQLIHIYSTQSFEHLQSIVMNPDNWSHIPDIRFVNSIHKVDPTTFLIGFSVIDDRDGRYRAYHRMDMDGNVDSNRFYEQELVKSYRFFNSLGMAGGIPLPSTREMLMDIANDGSFITAWTEDLAIKRHARDGTVESAVYIPYENSPLNPQDIIDIWGEVVEDADYPETWPAMEHLMVDDQNRIWAATIIDDKENLDWWVIDDQMELLAKFTWPIDKGILQIKNENLYTQERDEEEISHIVQYDIQLSPQSE